MDEQFTFTAPNTKSLSALLALDRVIASLKNSRIFDVAEL
jgi:hypothetical protein